MECTWREPITGEGSSSFQSSNTALLTCDCLSTAGSSLSSKCGAHLHKGVCFNSNQISFPSSVCIEQQWDPACVSILKGADIILGFTRIHGSHKTPNGSTSRKYREEARVLYVGGLLCKKMLRWCLESTLAKSRGCGTKQVKLQHFNAGLFFFLMDQISSKFSADRTKLWPSLLRTKSEMYWLPELPHTGPFAFSPAWMNH